MTNRQVGAPIRSLVVVEAEPLILGSASPRRAALLSQLGIRFRVVTADIEEHEHLVAGDATGVGSVTAIARAKFEAIGESIRSLDSNTRVLTADTLVVCQDQIMGKPSSDRALTTMIRQMSGRVVKISTAVCVGPAKGRPKIEVTTTKVAMRVIESGDIAAYVATGVGADKAGGLALQAEAGDFIESVEGCWSNVLGLPMCSVSSLLKHDENRCSVDVCGTWR